ncbi:MAG: AAA family ATPase [Nitrospirota bacterium]|nr:AAA family ATPase [Nitrospirota bacterium]
MLPAYLQYWGLKEAPFSLAPNPRLFYLSDQHRECLMRLKYAIHSGKGGALLISEEAGDGKTTTLQLLMQHLVEETRNQIRIAYLDYPTMTPAQMVAEIARQLGVEGVRGDKVHDINLLRDHLKECHARGMRNLVIVDEGQMMAEQPELLQEFRILLNFCSSGEFLLGFILSGQAPLDAAVRSFPEFWQRLPVRFMLRNLNQVDTCNLIHHRLAVAGAERPLFTDMAMQGIYRFSQGCPRVICAVADLALVVGHSNRARYVDFAEVTQACSDMEHSSSSYHYYDYLETEEKTSKGDWPDGLAPAATFGAADPAPGYSGGTRGTRGRSAPAPYPARTVTMPSPQIAFSLASESETERYDDPRALPTDPIPPNWAPAASAEPMTHPDTQPEQAGTGEPSHSHPRQDTRAADPGPPSVPPEALEGLRKEPVHCPHCGISVMSTTEACPKCHTLLKVACGRCRSLQSVMRNRCGYCGTPIHAWSREAERELLAGLKRLGMYRSPKSAERVKFNHHRTMEGRVLYFADRDGLFRQGAKIAEVKGDEAGTLKTAGIIVGSRRLVLLLSSGKLDMPLDAVQACDLLPEKAPQGGGLMLRTHEGAWQVQLPVREGRRLALYRLLQAYFSRMRTAGE